MSISRGVVCKSCGQPLPIAFRPALRPLPGVPVGGVIQPAPSYRPSPRPITGEGYGTLPGTVGSHLGLARRAGSRPVNVFDLIRERLARGILG